MCFKMICNMFMFYKFEISSGAFGEHFAKIAQNILSIFNVNQALR